MRIDTSHFGTSFFWINYSSNGFSREFCIAVSISYAVHLAGRNDVIMC